MKIILSGMQGILGSCFVIFALTEKIDNCGRVDPTVNGAVALVGALCIITSIVLFTAECES